MSEIIVICKDCNNEFTVSENEQNFYFQKGYELPKRCLKCRKQRRKNSSELNDKELERAKQEKWEKDEQEIARILSACKFPSAELSSLNACDNTKTLFVLGNGFDIMHGVSSAYSDFRDSLGKHSLLREALETYLKCDDLWYDFEVSLAHLDAGSMLDMTDMYMDIFNAYDEDAQAADYFMAIDAAMNPIQTIINDLPRRFRSWVESLTSMNRTPLEHLLCKNARYLNFNYTDFPEMLYGIPHEKITYIHGCRKKIKGKPKDMLILGHVPDVDYLENYIPNKSLMPRAKWKRAMVEMAMDQAVAQWVDAYGESFTKNTTEIIKNHSQIFNESAEFEDIYVIGHSMSEVDYPYFVEISRQNMGKAHWHIGYHSLDDLKRLLTLADILNLEKAEIFRT